MSLCMLYREDMRLPLGAVKEETSLADIARVSHQPLVRELVVKLYRPLKPQSVWDTNKALAAIGGVVNRHEKSAKRVFE